MGAELARRKEDKVKGGNVNYYLEIVPFTNGHKDVVVEVDDINEVMNFTFAEGTVFKSLVRLCKLRKDLGKPGSTSVYEAQKAVYYSQRIWVVSTRRLARAKRSPMRFWYTLMNVFTGNSELQYTPKTVIHVPDPKRLEPYSFVVEDFLEALGAAPLEKVIFNAIFAVGFSKLSGTRYLDTELIYANYAHEVSKQLLEYETKKKNFSDAGV